MEKQKIINAYAPVSPDEEARERMLLNILRSSENSLAGKDECKMRKKLRPVIIAAIVSLMILLMGCAILAWTLHDVKIGEINAPADIPDEQGNVKYEKGTPLDMVSIHGYAGSPGYLAQQEWFAFEQSYDPDLAVLAVSDDYVPPEEYSVYGVYSDEMLEKVDEIAAKYGLNLLGGCAYFQRSEKSTFYECLDIQSLLVSEADAVITKMSGYFYEAGNFKVEFEMEMRDPEKGWPYTMYNSIYYSRKDNFDVVYMNIGKTDLWEQWTYTTSSGYEVLIASRDYGAIVFCNKDDSFICVKIDNHYETDYNYETSSFDTNIVMSREQLEQIIDQIDFNIEVEFVDMDLAREQLEQFRNP